MTGLAESAAGWGSGLRWAIDLGDEEHLRIGPVGPSETQGRESAAGLALSLHGIALCLLFLVGIYDTQGSQGGLEIVPVEVEIAPQSASAQAEPPTSALPQPDAAHPLDATAHGVTGSSEPDNRHVESQSRLWRSCAGPTR
jgi:hypothetical protein